jgi:hypothetical protein
LEEIAAPVLLTPAALVASYNSGHRSRTAKFSYTFSYTFTLLLHKCPDDSNTYRCTERTQNPVGETLCGFKSHLRHQNHLGSNLVHSDHPDGKIRQMYVCLRFSSRPILDNRKKVRQVWYDYDS